MVAFGLLVPTVLSMTMIESLQVGVVGALTGGEPALTRTSSEAADTSLPVSYRRVLGCMNDMAFLCEAAITGSGGLARCDLGELNQALHRNINSTRGCRPPVELAAERLEHGDRK
ncbi:MAG: hypothetical protein ACLQDY_13810 [Streptosporangiaceae bacterium]